MYSPDSSGGGGRYRLPTLPDPQHVTQQHNTSNDGPTNFTPADGASGGGSPSAMAGVGSSASPSFGSVGSNSSVAAAGRPYLSAERPAVLEKVCDESVLAEFNFLGSSERFPLVGCVVAAVSKEPFASTEVSPKVR